MKKKIILIFVILVSVAALLAYGVLNYGHSEGVRIGKLVKISQKGFLVKTYEGTLDLGSGDQLTWDFSVHHKEIGKELMEQSGREIKLHYKEHLMKLFFETKYNVTGYELMTKNDGAFRQYFCLLISVLRKDRELVEKARELIQKHSPDLLKHIRSCQQ